MSNQEILDKAISKAIEGGWKGSPYLDYERLTGESWRSNMVMGEGIWLVALIYSPPHEFAKSLWGEEPYRYTTFLTEETHGEYKKLLEPPKIDELYVILNWQYHLQQMVIADDPIKYLGANL